MSSFGAGLACGIGCGIASGMLLGKQTGTAELLKRLKESMEQGELVVKNQSGETLSADQLIALLSMKPK